MHNIYAIPRLVYGLEALILTQPNTNTLEASHKTSLRKIQHLPKSTATAAIYLLIGTPPLEATIHIKTICFFLTQLRRSDSIEYQLIERQLAMKKDSANSWTWYVNKLLKRYHLPSAFALLKKQPTKDVWKNEVKKKVLSAWEDDLIKEAREKSTLDLLNLEVCGLQHPHPAWQLGAANIATVMKATIRVKLLTQRYPLFYSKTSGQNYGKNCPLCQEAPETMHHFLLTCKTLEGTRAPFIQRLRQLLAPISMPQDETMCIKLLLDPSHYIDLENLHPYEQLSRDLCYHLHHERTINMGKPPTTIKRTQNILNHTVRGIKQKPQTQSGASAIDGT